MSTSDLSDSIAKSAAAPRRVKGDEGEVEQHSLTDQIAADKHLARVSGADHPARLLRFARCRPPGGR